jgi:LPXTG-site transpeptidase (sortase) family protein
MQQLRRHWFVLSIICILILIGAGLILVSSSKQKSSHVTVAAISEIVPHTAAVTVPSQQNWKKGALLEIPSIKLTAPIENVGVRDDGKMEVPRQHQWEGVGWYKFGTFPGEQGSAVIDGHLDRPGGYPAVFWNLNKLHIGDIITIVNPGEKTLHFKVKDMQYYQPQNAPLPKIFGDHSGAYLNLVTCAGEWIPAIQQTTLRLVVYTEMVI